MVSSNEVGIEATRHRGDRDRIKIMAEGCDTEIQGCQTHCMPAGSVSTPTTILVGLDGSEMSHRAVAHAAAYAKALGAEVVAVHAVGLMSIIDGEHVPSRDCRDRIDSQVHEWVAPLRDAGVEHRTICEDGPPGLVLLRLIERVGAGLVVLGTRGIGSAEGVVLGSTSYYLVQHSPVPVLVTH